MRNRRVVLQRGERGAVLVIVAAFALVAILMLAFVVDLGSQRSELKQATLSTDSAALAAASVVDFDGTWPPLTGSVSCQSVPSLDDRWGGSVQDVVEHYLSVNGESLVESCLVTFDPAPARRSAYVTVTASDTVQYQFANSVGQKAGSVRGSSSARVAGTPWGNLYPVGLCSDGAEALAPSGSATFDPALPSTVTFDPLCGGPGNKRQVQFDLSSPPPACDNIGNWCKDFNNGGYDGAPQIVESDTGKDWQKAEATILVLRATRTPIWVPAVRERSDLVSSSPGTKFKYEVTHFVEVIITGYSKTAGLSFDIYQIVPYNSDGPPEMSNIPFVPAHLCGTGAGQSGCDYKAVTAPGGSGVDPGVDLSDPCLATATGPSTVPTKRAGNTVYVKGFQAWSLAIATPSDCGFMTGEAVGPKTSVDLGGSGNAASTMSLTLGDDTPLHPREENNAPFDVIFYSDGVEVYRASFVTSKK